jgi:ABC-type transporter Mla subunit MlaD
VDRQAEVLETATADVAATVTQVQNLTSVVVAQQAALEAIGRRSSELLATLSAHSGDIQDLVSQAAALAQEIRILLDSQLDTIDDGFVLAAETMQVLIDRQQQISTVLSRLPAVADLTQRSTDLLLRQLRNEKGYYVTVGATNSPDLNRALQILKDADR